MLKTENLKKAFGSKVVLDGASFVINPGEKIGLVGPNGVGKSTLMRIICGIEEPDTGTIVRTGIRVGYLPQDFRLIESKSVQEAIEEKSGLSSLRQELRLLEDQMAEKPDDSTILERYGQKLSDFEAVGGYEFESRLEQVLKAVGMDVDTDRLVSTLSGGQKSKVGLAGILASGSDLILLDEPTNNLDLEAIERVEYFITGSSAAFLIVSHDRAFLDTLVSTVFEVDQFKHAVTRYEGGYSDYLEEKERRHQRQLETYQGQQGEIQRLKESARRKQIWASKGKTATRSDGDKLRAGAARDRSGALGVSARVIERRIERMDLVEKPQEPWRLKLDLTSSLRSGDKVVTLKEVEKVYPDFHLGPINLKIQCGERVAILGPNGSGKTTLLNIVLERIKPDEGEVTRGTSVIMGYFSQEHKNLRDGNTVLHEFLHQVPMDESEARTLLAKFSFRRDVVHKTIERMSPGERARLTLAILMAKRSNFLVLDEPTNHLDLEAAEQIQEALCVYDGTLLMVSHDRYLLDHLEITRRITLKDGRTE